MSRPVVASPDPGTAVALRAAGALDEAGFPRGWSRALPVRFNADWQGENADPQRSTEVRVLWNAEQLFLRFQANYRTLTLFENGDPDGRRDQLWERDVCEAFLQPDPSEHRRYAEFEISPNGLWIDIAIDADHLENKPSLRSGLVRRVALDDKQQTWVGELAIPMRALTDHFNPAQPWRANFFHVEGPSEPRFYSSWRPTRTPEPRFHVPEVFGRLIFVETEAA
jgi:hypothetical protein